MASTRDPFDERLIEMFGLSPYTEKPLLTLANWVLLYPGIFGFLVLLLAYAVLLLYLPARLLVSLYARLLR